MIESFSDCFKVVIYFHLVVNSISLDLSFEHDLQVVLLLNDLVQKMDVSVAHCCVVLCGEQAVVNLMGGFYLQVRVVGWVFVRYDVGQSVRGGP